MKIKCMGCSEFEFDITFSKKDFYITPMLTFLCPNCGRYTTLTEGHDDRIVIALDTFIESKRTGTIKAD